MPDENEEKKSKEKKQEVTTEITFGVTNEQPVVYSTNDAFINSIEAPNNDIHFVQNIHRCVDFNDNGVNYATGENITLYSDNDMDTSSLEVGNFVEENYYGITLKGDKVCKYTYNFQNLFDINIQKNQRSSITDICANMKEFINENKYTNPKMVQVAIATLQTVSYLYYDEGTNNILGASGFTRKDLGETSEEVLWKLYNTSEGDMLEGFVCSTISDFVMRLLHECDIEAVMFCGGKSGSDHTTLLYKQEDGKYVYVNQGEFATVEASNIKDAVKALHRNNTSPGDFGYIMLIDENNSYQEFDLQDETIWGYELDKRDYNQTIAQLPAIENHPSIKVDYNRSLIGGNEINLTGTYVKNNEENSVSQKTLSLGFKNNQFNKFNTYSYNSFGIKYETDSLKGKEGGSVSYKSSKSILSTTGINFNEKLTVFSGFYNDYYLDYSEESLKDAQITMDMAFENQVPEGLSNEDREEIYNSYYTYNYNQDSPNSEISIYNNLKTFQNFMLFNRSARGVQTKINDNLSTTSQVSSTVGLNLRPFDGLVFCGDLRLTAEQSLNYKKKKGKSEVSADINGGIVGDMSIHTGVLKPGIAFGVKGNAGASFETHLTDNLSVGLNASGYGVTTPVSTDYGLKAGTGFCYKNKNTSIFGQVNARLEKQNLHMEKLNEQTENAIGLEAVLGVSNKQGSIQVGYSAKTDKLNPTKNRNMFSLGVNFNL